VDVVGRQVQLDILKDLTDLESVDKLGVVGGTGSVVLLLSLRGVEEVGGSEEAGEGGGDENPPQA